jgi:hypothetical protein
MKTLNKISICLIISLGVFACVEKDCFSLSGHSFYVIENTANEQKSDNSITSHNDLSDVDVTLTKSICPFDLKDLSSEEVTTQDSFIPLNIYFRIWQPPKVS